MHMQTNICVLLHRHLKFHCNNNDNIFLAICYIAYLFLNTILIVTSFRFEWHRNYHITIKWLTCEEKTCHRTGKKVPTDPSLQYFYV